WGTADGRSGAGQAVGLTGDTGYFWFFSPGNVEMILKVVDGRVVNSNFWVFAGGLTDVDVLVTITDTKTGTVRTYLNPQGTGGRADCRHRILLVFQPEQCRDGRQGRGRLQPLLHVLGLRGRPDGRQRCPDRHRHEDRRGQDLSESSGRSVPAHPGHERLRRLPVKAPASALDPAGE